jgi:hypothetical protein
MTWPLLFRRIIDGGMARGLTPPQIADCTMDQIMLMCLPVENLGADRVIDASAGWPADVPRAKAGIDTSGGASVVQRLRAKRKPKTPEQLRDEKRARRAAIKAAKQR